MSTRTVVVTGAASGIGHATAELFRDLGDTVYGLDVAASTAALLPTLHSTYVTPSGTVGLMSRP